MALPQRESLNRLSRWGIFSLIAFDVAIGVVLRFKTTSKLWLDEAQSVNIAAHPLSQLTHLLRHDGAPPLYYVLLHLWMGAFGHSDFDVRALSGVIAVLALGASYLAIRAWYDRLDAALTLGIFAVLPYAIYFGTETRQYSLVMLLAALLLWALRKHLDRPRVTTAVWLAVLGALLLYTHYWAIYLLGIIGLYGVIRWWLHRKESDRRDWMLPVSLGAAFVLWAPWIPIFNEQRLHTGTPWSTPPTLYQLLTWFDGFTVNQSVPHVVASLHTEISIVVFVALVIFGVFGYRLVQRSRLITLDWAGISETRTIAFIVIGTMAAGLVASHIDGSAYVPRYAAVIAVPITYLAARGVRNCDEPLKILVVLTLLSGALLWTDKWGVTSQRTQAGQIATALAAAPAHSIVYVCPDQLGPSLLRYSNPTLDYRGYPRFASPSIVDWYDYMAAYRAHSVAENAASQAATISPTESVYVVRAHNYGIKETCWLFEQSIANDLHRSIVPIVKEKIGGYYQPMELQQLVTVRH